MIIERLVWQAKFGQGDAVVAAFKEFRDRLAREYGMGKSRILVDATGPMFTVVVENEYADMADVARLGVQREQSYANADFQEWFGKWVNAVERGTRELYTVVD